MKSFLENIVRRLLLTVLAGVCFGSGDSHGNQAASPQAAVAMPAVEVGLASFYADKYHGRTTASGEVFDTRELTAAHRTLPFGTRVKVTAVEHDRSVIVRINDRGPFVAGRVIDVSRAAAEELQITRAGLVKVRLEILPPAAP